MSDGPNAFVNIETGVVNPNSAYTYQDREYAKTLADQMLNLMLTSIDDMQGVLANYKPSAIDIDTDIPEASGPNYPDPLALSPLQLDNNWPTNYPRTPTLMSYGVMDFSFLEPTPPDNIDSNFSWLGTEYSSELFEALFDRVIDNVRNGGYGLTDAVYTSIINMAQEAKRISQDRLYRAALDSVGESGFNLGAGILGGLQVETFRELAKLDQDYINNTTIKNFDMATENTKFFVTTGVELEKLLRQAYEATENRSLEASKFAKDITIQVYAEFVKSFIAKWEGVKINLEAYLGKIEAITAYNNGQISVFEGVWKGISTQVSAIASKNEAMISDRKNLVDIYKVEVDAVSSQWSTSIASANLELEGIKLQVQLAIEEAKTNLDAYIGQAELGRSIADSISKIAAQAMASALGIIHTSLSSSYSSSEAISESWGHSENLSESHSYSEE